MQKRRQKSVKRQPISRALRKAIKNRKLSAYATAKQAHVSVDAVQRFMNNERGLSLATVDRLAAALDLEICEDEEGLAPK